MSLRINAFAQQAAATSSSSSCGGGVRTQVNNNNNNNMQPNDTFKCCKCQQSLLHPERIQAPKIDTRLLSCFHILCPYCTVFLAVKSGLALEDKCIK